jgi:peptidoglycan/LPS O-acetylase OafA/YrhL
MGGAVSLKTPTHQHLAGLDGLRAISILLVIAAHLFTSHPNGVWHSNFSAGNQGVMVFFVISGFLITFLLCSEESANGRVSVAGFYYRRAFRILPPALTYLFATAALSPRSDLWHSVFFMRNFFPYIGGDIAAGGAVNGHFWTLSVEEQFYLFWPAIFLLLVSPRNRLRFVGALVILLPLWQIYALRVVGNFPLSFGEPNIPHPVLVGGLILYAGHYPILVGCFLALAKYCYPRETLKLSDWRIAAAAAVLVSFLVVESRLTKFWPFLVALVINWAVSQRKSFLDWKPLAWVGKISYSLYLWQQLFCFESVIPIVGRPPLNVVASFGCASLSYYLVERPALRLRDWLKRRSSPIPVPLPSARPDNS